MSLYGRLRLVGRERPRLDAGQRRLGRRHRRGRLRLAAGQRERHARGGSGAAGQEVAPPDVEPLGRDFGRSEVGAPDAGHGLFTVRRLAVPGYGMTIDRMPSPAAAPELPAILEIKRTLDGREKRFDCRLLTLAADRPPRGCAVGRARRRCTCTASTCPPGPSASATSGPTAPTTSTTGWIGAGRDPRVLLQHLRPNAHRRRA